MGERLTDLAKLRELAEGVEGFVLLGMGGSSLAPEVLRRLFGAEDFQVLDTTHPKAIRRVEEELDLARALFVVSSKSGTTLDACRSPDANPGLELGLELGNGWQDGRDTIGLRSNPGEFGLWVEQLLAESTGKQGKGLIPAPDDPNASQKHDVEIAEPYDVGPE